MYKTRSIAFKIEILDSQRESENIKILFWKFKKNRGTELISNILAKQVNCLHLFKLLFKEFFSYHILSGCLTLLIIIFQIQFAKTCYLYPICKCYDNIWIKIYNLAKDILLFWSYIAYLLYNSIFILKELNNKKLYQVAFFVLIFSFITYIYLTQNGDTDFPTTIWIYLFSYSISFLTFVYYLILLRFQWKKWIENMFNSGILSVVIYSIHLFSTYVLAPLKYFINDRVGDLELSKNIFQFILLLYSKALILIISFCLWRFYQILTSEGNNKDDITLKLTFVARFSLIYVIGINVSTILRMNLRDWGAWVAIISYVLFLLKCYTRFDIYSWLFQKLCLLIKKKKVEEKKTEARLYFEKVLSGCVLDLQFIIGFRLLVLFFWKKWLNLNFSSKYYADCELTLNEQFPINLFSLLLILGVNWILVCFIFLYIRQKQKIILYYKINRNIFLNFYIIFLMNVYCEIIIQLYTFVFFEI